MTHAVSRPIRRYVAFTLLLLVSQAASAQTVAVYRDKVGTPSIVATRLQDAMYGLGYAMAQDNAEQMARNFKQARGRRAEVDGQSALLTDSFLRALAIEERAEKAAPALPSEPKMLIERFCAGANRSLAEQKPRLPDWIEPFTPVDVLSLAQLAQAAFPLQEISNQLLPGAGSNQFAIAPRRSANGHAILSMDPHLQWSGILLWYEFAIYSRDFNFHGITPSGLPLGSMGHTDHVAWSMTNNNPRLHDFLTVTTNPSNPKQYSYHGEWRNFEEMPVEMRYRENGVLKSNRQIIRRTAWGPMVPFRPQSVRLAIPEIRAMLEQSLKTMRARSSAEFHSALQGHGLSMWNVVYADSHGHIGYQYNANLPRRNEGFDWTKPVPGADPKTRWTDYWSLDELPHAEDPASGLLINANTAPWLTTLGNEIPDKGWPAYVTGYGVTTRYERLETLLRADSHVTIEEAKRYATDTLVPYARSAIAALLAALPHAAGVQANSPGANGADKTDRTDRTDTIDTTELSRSGAKILAAWNGRADPGARGCGLYLYWLRADKRMAELARRADKGSAWTEQEQAAAVAAFNTACKEMTAQHGSLDVPWSDIHVSQRGAQTVPVSGMGYVSPGDSTATVTPNFGPFRDGKIVCNGGSSFRMLVDLDPKGVKSWSILPYGDSQDPSNPHYADQQAMFGRGDYKDTYFGVARIKKVSSAPLVLKTH